MSETLETSPILTLVQEPIPNQLEKDLLAGSLAGVIIVLSGHPLDTIKVRMQMLHQGFIKTFVNLVKSEGVLALYKGVKSPLYSTPVLSSLTFAAYESATRFHGLKRGDKRTTSVAFSSGLWAGCVYSFITTPIDLLKNRLQMEGVGDHTKSTKLSSMVKYIVKNEGPLVMLFYLLQNKGYLGAF